MPNDELPPASALSDAEATFVKTLGRYLRAKSKGDAPDVEVHRGADAPDPAVVFDGSRYAGTYARSAASVLRRWFVWLRPRDAADFDILGDPERGASLMRSYAQHFGRRVQSGSISAASVRNYWNIISGALAFAIDEMELSRNPARASRATSMLPEEGVADSESDQQFWDADARTEILRHLRKRAHDAVDEQGLDALPEMRDRAFGHVIAYSGVRGAEVLRSDREVRDGRTGLRWDRVGPDYATLRVLGKSQKWEDASLLDPAQGPLERWHDRLDPASDEWPVFPSFHAPTLRAAGEKQDVAHDAVTSADGVADLLDAFREGDAVPPAVSVSGMRQHFARVFEAAGITVDGETPTLHGARRGLGDEIYQQDHELAQDVLRHVNLSTTHSAYATRQAEERTERASEVVSESENSQ